MKGFFVHKKNGVTLVEIMMVVAVMGVLFMGLFSLITRVTKGTWQIGGMLSLNSAASEAMYWIGNDFRNAKASTMGDQLVDNLLGDEAMNPGFELPLNLTSDFPATWASLSLYGVSRVSGPSNVRSGFLALGMLPGTAYYSQVLATTYTARQYFVSAWSSSTAQVELRLLTSAAVDTDFVPACFINNAGSSMWVHLVTTTNLTTNFTPFKVRMRYLGVSNTGLFDDVCMSPRQVVFSGATTDRNYEYYTSKGSSNSESNRFKRYRLNYTPIAARSDPAWPGIVRRQRFAGGSWINDGQENFCNNVQQLIITNNNQESFDVELVLEKVIELRRTTGVETKTKEYRMKSRFTPVVP